MDIQEDSHLLFFRYIILVSINNDKFIVVQYYETVGILYLCTMHT